MRSKRSSHEQKRRNLTPLFVFILLYPYIVGYTSDSTDAYAELLVGAGGGQYARHDCSGAHKQGFGDAGVHISSQYYSPFRFGLSIGGIYTGPNGGGGFVYPDLGFEWDNLAFGTTGVRIGSLQDWYIEGKILDRPPFFSGIGFARAGVGKYIPEMDSRFWIGVNSFPYVSNGAAIMWEMPIGERKYLYFNGRYGTDKSSNIEEYGISAGLRFITP
jgi:hypothetical protein